MPKQEPEQSPATDTTSAEGSSAAASEGDLQGGTEKRERPRQPSVRYLGFRSTPAGREYSLRVTDGLEPRFFVVLIPHDIFASREARFQDAPDLCFAKLQRDLVANPDLAPGSPLVLTAQELFEYRNARDRSSPSRKRRGSAG